MNSDPDDEFEPYGSERIWLHPSELGSLLPPAPAERLCKEVQLRNEKRGRMCLSRRLVATFALFLLAALSVLVLSAVPAAFPFLVVLACAAWMALVNRTPPHTGAGKGDQDA